MSRNLAAAASVALVLSSCATSSETARMRSYNQKATIVKMPDETYRLYDHPTDSTVIVSPGLGRVVAIGITQGATLGLADAMTPEQRMEAAARQHLANTGRGACSITSGYLLVKPLYEFSYTCKQREP